MKKVGIVSCDKWKGKIEEDQNLKEFLREMGIEADIISWQKPILDYDLLVIRSIWGYQNHYQEFISWLNNTKMPMCNKKEILLENIKKDRQFQLLDRHGIDHVETTFLSKDGLEDSIRSLMKKDQGVPFVIKPSISGSGENTFRINGEGKNSIPLEAVEETYHRILEENPDCKIMIQPYQEGILDGEYSCIFINGKLTHTMKRFPSVFHEKRKTEFVEEVPREILELAQRVEQLEEYKDYLYMRVDMILSNGKAKVMEVELTEPDLLTRKIEDPKIKKKIIHTFAQSIKERI